MDDAGRPRCARAVPFPHETDARPSFRSQKSRFEGPRQRTGYGLDLERVSGYVFVLDRLFALIYGIGCMVVGSSTFEAESDPLAPKQRDAVPKSCMRGTWKTVVTFIDMALHRNT
jgi:hypothetical protein